MRLALFTEIVLSYALFFLVHSASAEPMGRIIFHKLDLKFAPESAFFFTYSGEAESKKMAATIVPLAGDGVEGKTHEVLVGGDLGTGTEGSAWRDYGLVVLGVGKELYFQPHASTDKSAPLQTIDSAESMKARKDKIESELKGVNSELKTQSEALRRLRDDAELIGGIGRIVEVRDEIDRLADETRSVEKDTETLKKFLNIQKQSPLPNNFVSRELELSRQLAELTQAAEIAEVTLVKRVKPPPPSSLEPTDETTDLSRPISKRQNGDEFENPGF